jgi:ABC-type oligopeptide transport system substrate-binding subunit
MSFLPLFLVRCLAGAWLGLLAGSAALAEGPSARVLRVATSTDAVSLDPQRVSDLYSSEVLGHITETLYSYEYLARPSGA